MTHLLHYPTASDFACGVNAVGRRDTRTQLSPDYTTCPQCLAWIDGHPEWEPQPRVPHETPLQRLMREVFE